MNDMIHNLESIQAITTKRASIDSAHILRSKIIDKCASVETWLVSKIQPYEKPSPMFSIKMNQLSAILGKHPKEFNKPEILKRYIEEFQPFSAFRSELAHSKISVIEQMTGPMLIKFQNAMTGSDPKTAKSLVISEDELDNIWKEMCKAAQKITNYKINPPSSPPQQMQGATTGP